MASKPRLTYFNGRGNGELPRLVLAHAGVDYDDIRVSDLTELKASGKLLFGQVPLLEMDGVSIVQSHSIARYLARKHNLYGSSNEEAAKIDQVLDGFIDLRNRFFLVREASPAEKDAKMEEFKTKTVPHWFGLFEKVLEREGTGYFVGSKATLADLQGLNLLWNFENAVAPGCLASFPLLKAHLDRMSNLPNLKRWLEIRPKSAF